MKYCENHVFVWKLYHFYVFFMLLTWDVDQGPHSWTKDHRKRSLFFPTPNKVFMPGTWNFRIIEKKIRAIFREYLSSLHFDSGKIFKLMTFRRGPRTTYCTGHLTLSFCESLIYIICGFFVICNNLLLGLVRSGLSPSES